jgi:hypothetical protein
MSGRAVQVVVVVLVVLTILELVLLAAGNRHGLQQLWGG